MDEKQWLVSRLDTTNKIIFDEFQLSKEELVRIRNELRESIAVKRNIILSIAGFVVSLLVALYETHWIDRIRFLEILVPDLLTGIATLLLSSLFGRSNSQSFIRVENSIVEAQQALNHNFGFLIQNTLELTSVPIDKLREYGDFLRALSGIIYIPFSNALIQSSKSKLLDEYYKKFFIDNVMIFEKVIEPAIGIFNRINITNLPSQSMEYVNKTIPTYTKYDVPTKNK